MRSDQQKVEHDLPSLSAILQAPSEESLCQFSGSPQALRMPSMNSIMNHSLDSLFPNPQEVPLEILPQRSKDNHGFHSCQGSTKESLDSYSDPAMMMCQERLPSVDQIGPAEDSALQSSWLLREKKKNRFGSNQSMNSERSCCSPVPEMGPEDTIETAPKDISRWTPSVDSQEFSASLDTFDAPMTPSLRDSSLGDSSSQFTVPSISSFGDASKTSPRKLSQADSKDSPDVIHEFSEDCLSILEVESMQTNTIEELEELRKAP